MAFAFTSPAEAVAAIGRDLGISAWVMIDQERIDTFARATGDHQWIHVDPERARTGPFGTTVAHGYLTLSLVNMLLPELFRAEGATMGINYGTDRVRFPSPVPVDSRVWARGALAAAQELGGNSVQTTVRITIEVEGQAKPACVADILGRYYF